MSQQTDSLECLVEKIKRKAPEYLDVMAAENDEEFEGAFDRLLEFAICHLERNKGHFATLNEEGLTAVLAAALSIPGLTVMQEAHSNGHVDLTIEVDHCTPARRKLGEAKIYDGPEYHLKGLEQLLGRYTTGREGRGLIIEYVRKNDIAGLVLKVRAKMDSDLPMRQQGIALDHAIKWSFTTTHAHDCGEDLQVSHVGCNVHTP